MSAAKHTVANGGAALGVDPDPNVTPPKEDRIFTIAKAPAGAQGIWLAAEGGNPDCELWCKVTANKWLPMSLASFGGGTTISLAANAVRPMISGFVITDAPCFVRVTVPNGATAIHVGTSIN